MCSISTSKHVRGTWRRTEGGSFIRAIIALSMAIANEKPENAFGSIVTSILVRGA